jgi:signal transduction histidine kinase
MVIAAAIAGWFVTDLVVKGAVESRAGATALLMRSLVEPVTQDLATTGMLSKDAISRLDGRLSDPAFRERFPFLEIWSLDGVAAYSTTPALIGQKFHASASRTAAAAGEVAAEFSNLHADEHTMRGIGTSYLEVYAPIRESGTGRIIGVAEIHEHTNVLERDLASLKANTWALVGLVTSLIMLGLFSIVNRGSRLIEAQTETLRRQVFEVEASAHEIRRLQERSRRASLQLAELNESFLRRLGADLHDGPAQMLGFAALKMEEVRRARSTAARAKAVDIVEGVLQEAVREVRTIARGLLLPEIADLSLPAVVERAVDAHRNRTGTEVAIAREGAFDVEAPAAIKACAFRFVQEGLQNAFRHAAAAEQTVRFRIVDGRSLFLSVLDRGAQPACAKDPAGGLGLHGLRQRVESLGGTFITRPRRCGGTRLDMIINLEDSVEA